MKPSSKPEKIELKEVFRDNPYIPTKTQHVKIFRVKSDQLAFLTYLSEPGSRIRVGGLSGGEALSRSLREGGS